MTEGSAGEGALRVLAVLDDVQVARTIQRVVAEEGDAYTRVASVEEAVTLATNEPIDVAFIELRAESGAALALCHHLPSVRPELNVQAIVHPSDLARGPEALSLGSTSKPSSIRRTSRADPRRCRWARPPSCSRR